MKIEKQIKEWVESWLINQKVADKMLVDLNRKSKDDKSNKFIVAISTIWALLLWVWAILFIASNWREIPNILKVIMILVFTFWAFFLGYFFKYEKKSLPKVWSSLIFLSSLLFWASVFLVSQIYHINANASSILLIWLAWILPLVYAFNSKSVLSVFLTILLIWFWTFLIEKDSFSDYILLYFPVIYLITWILFYTIWWLHSFFEKISSLWNVYKYFWIWLSLILLYVLTFPFFSSLQEFWSFWLSSNFEIPSYLTITISTLWIFSILWLVINLFFNSSKTKEDIYEIFVFLGIIALALFFFFFPPTSSIFNVLFNLTFAFFTIFLIYLWYQKSNIWIVNLGIFWLAIFLITKYFDFFWNLMSRSVFFMVWWLILIFWGIALEKQRRKLKENFNKLNK